MKEARDRAVVPRRGRPNLRATAELESRVLTAGREMFLSTGYASTTMEAVAAAAGVSKGTLYARYSDKSALFHAIVGERLEFWSASKPLGVRDRVRPLAEQLSYIGMSFLEGVREPEASAFHHLLAAEAGRFPELAKAFYERGYMGAVRQSAEAIRRAADVSGADVDDPYGVALAFNSALLGWINSQRILGDVTDDQCVAFVDNLVAIFTEGSRAKRQAPCSPLADTASGEVRSRVRPD